MYFRNYRLGKPLLGKCLNWEKVFLFRDDCIWIGCGKLSLLTREYLWPAVTVLKNSPKILSITKRDFFKFNFVHNDQ